MVNVNELLAAVPEIILDTVIVAPVATPKLIRLVPKAIPVPAVLKDSVPASALILVFEATVTAPVIVLVPVIFLMTPSLLIPVPNNVIGFATKATPPSICIALPSLIVIDPAVVPKTLVLDVAVGDTFKILLFAATLILPVNPVLFPFKVSILDDPVPSFVIVPPPNNKPVTVTPPSPPIDKPLLVLVFNADVALLNVSAAASELILDPVAFTRIVPDKVLPVLVLGHLNAPVVLIPVPLIVKNSGIVSAFKSNTTAAPDATTV